MPYPMTHLIIAGELLAQAPPWLEAPQFILGSIAPDAVHFRIPYQSGYKLASHLCPGDEPWGFVTKNDAWTQNVLALPGDESAAASRSFVLGYCAHILADIHNNIEIWTPLRRGNNPHYNENYHASCKAADFLHHHRYPGRARLWLELERSRAEGLPGIIPLEEVAYIRENILRKQYANVNPALHANGEEMAQIFLDFALATAKKIAPELGFK